MNLIKIIKNTGKAIWINIDGIVSFQEAGAELIINCEGNLAYRIAKPKKEIVDFLKNGVVFECEASRE